MVLCGLKNAEEGYYILGTTILGIQSVDCASASFRRRGRVAVIFQHISLATLKCIPGFNNLNHHEVNNISFQASFLQYSTLTGHHL